MFDAVIIGAGTAGMTAGIYLARRGMSAVILENNTYGGQIVNSREVENYPGLKNISGFDFATELYEQVTSLGGHIEFANVTGIKTDTDCKTVMTTDKEYKCKNIIIASGAANRKLGLEEEDELIGRGISYCATCDGSFFRDKPVAVVGGGNTALDDAKFLSEICAEVLIIHRRDEFRGDSRTVRELSELDNVKFVMNSLPVKLSTDDSGKLAGVIIRDKISGAVTELSVKGLFVAVGQVPNTAFLKDSGVNLDKYGYVIAGEDCRTNIEGIYAAGDCRTKALRQLTTAAADGSIAATLI